MSYYTGVGDYYSGKGDPGLFGSIGSVIGKVGGLVGSILPGPIGAGAKLASKLFTGTKSTARAPRAPTPTPGMRGILERAVPGGRTGYECGSSNGCSPGYHLNKGGENPKTYCVKNRKTNYANPKALSRAADRMDGFVSIARKGLKHTPYKIVNKNYRSNWRKPTKK